jgi:site-specific recombinase XerD
MQNINKQYVGNLMAFHLKVRPNSQAPIRKNCFLSFCDTFNHYDIQQITPEALKNWFLKLRKEKGYTDSSLNKTRAGINHFFKHMLEENIIITNPLASIWFKGKQAKKRDRVILSPEEIKKTLELMKKFSPDVLYPYIFVLAYTGARLGEIRTLKWKRVNFASEHLYLIYTKNGDERRLPARKGEAVYEFLTELQKKRGHKSEFVFLNQWGKLLSASQIRDMIIKFQKTYPDQKRWRCHDLRHGFAHNYLKREGSMYALQAILGHRSIKQTIDLYGQLQASDVEMVSPYD